jgi:hypothetical protein
VREDEAVERGVGGQLERARPPADGERAGRAGAGELEARGRDRRQHAERDAIATDRDGEVRRDVDRERARGRAVVDGGAELERVARAEPPHGDLAQPGGLRASGDGAGAADRERAAEADLRQRDVRRGAGERELEPGAGDRAAEPDRAGDHPDTAGVRDELDALGRQRAEAGDVGGQRAASDEDAAQAGDASGAIRTGRVRVARVPGQPAQGPGEVGVAARIDADRDARPVDAQLVGAQPAAEQGAHRDRRLERLGRGELAEPDVREPDGAGEIGVDAADPGRHAGRGGDAGREAILHAADPCGGAGRDADGERGGGGEDPALATRDHAIG